MNTEEVFFQFVEPEQTTPDKERIQPASYVRKVFELERPIIKATLYSTALGVYEPYVNGKKVEAAKLMPGFTNYRKRVQYFKTDVTALVKEGKNVMGAIVGDGWYRGSLGAFSERACYGDKIQFAASLEVQTAEETVWIYTDEDTKATQDGPIQGNDIKTFEIVDMTKEMDGWNMPEFDDGAWHPCKLGSYEGEITLLEGEKITDHECFSPQVLRTPNGETLLDFGQNMSGHVEFTVTGHAGDQVMLEMGEILDEEGNFTTKNLSEISVEKVERNMEIPKSILGQTLVYTLKDGRQTYASTFLVSGFRYVRVKNWPEPVAAENFKAIAIYADMGYGGEFTCSNEKINQLVSNVRWSQKSNFVDVPTDCPTRERAGWTGDVNVFVETACYLADTRKQLRKWLHDFVGLQRDDGSLPFIVPEVPMPTEGVDMQSLPYSSAGWSDALLNVAMVLYRFYGDEENIRLIYKAAKKFVNYNARRAKEKHKLHFYKLGRHYKYILDTGYHWGEWLEPGNNMTTDAIRALVFPDAEVATAWFYHSAKQLGEMAAILHKTEDERTYKELAEKIQNAYRKEFLRFGNVHSKRQCRYVRPLSMGLIRSDAAKKNAARLNDMCMKNGYKVGTGFLTTYQILQTLSEYGYGETAYRMLVQEQCPGWMYEINRGATTIWENWVGIDENGIPKDSQNHYAMGAAVAWLFSHVGGIQPMEPGFRKVLICPHAVGDLDWAKTVYESVHGKMEVEWERKGNRFKVRVSLPADVKGVLVLPDGSREEIAGIKERT